MAVITKLLCIIEMVIKTNSQEEKKSRLFLFSLKITALIGEK